MPSPGDILSAQARVPEHVVYRSFEEETLLLNLETGQYHGLNPTGGRVLELLGETGGSISEAIDRLAGECHIEPDEIQEDIVGFFAELAGRGLIVIDGPSLD